MTNKIFMTPSLWPRLTPYAGVMKFATQSSPLRNYSITELYKNWLDQVWRTHFQIWYSVNVGIYKMLVFHVTVLLYDKYFHIYIFLIYPTTIYERKKCYI